MKCFNVNNRFLYSVFCSLADYFEATVIVLIQERWDCKSEEKAEDFM